MNKRNIVTIFFLVLIVSVSQFILAAKHLEFGFFTDDWLFLSAFRAYVSNPFLDIIPAWKAIGSHNFSYVYYQGILFNFFGLDYSAYRYLNLILKIIATLSLYPLVLYISKRRLLAFLVTFIYAIHYSPFGLLDGASRGGNFIAIALMNLFLLAYFYITGKKIFNIFLLLGLAVLLFTAIFFSTTRVFPLLLLVPIIEILNFIQEKKVGQIKLSLKRLSVLYSPLIFLFIFSPGSITQQLRYSIGLFDKLRDGNWQLLLTPFAAFGSTYIPKQLWFLFGHPVYGNLGSYLTFLLLSPILLFLIIQSILGFVVSKKPLKFMLTCFGLNLLFGLIVFFLSNNWLFLNQETKAPVDPGTFLVPALIGLFVLTAGFALLLEWKESKAKNNLLPFIFISQLFSLLFIFLTWIFADVNSIFNTVHAYLNIPAIGTSIVLASIVYILYERVGSVKVFNKNKIIATFLISTMLFFYFKLSSVSIDNYFSYWLDNGLRAKDQNRILDQFWIELGNENQYSQQNLPLIYIDSLKDPNNGSFYSEVIIWRMAAWFDLRYKKNKDGRFSLCQLLVLDETKLKNHVRVSKDKKSLIYDGCGTDEVYKIENFYAFQLKDRNLIPNRLEVLKKLGAIQ